METHYYIILILIAFAGGADAIIDTINFHYESSKLPNGLWWNPKFSWLSKWELTLQLPIPINTKRKWYYLWLYIPKYKERFPYSSTLLVFTTDAFHLFKSIKLNAIFLALTLALDLVVIDSILAFIILRIIYGIIFEQLFNRWLQK